MLANPSISSIHGLAPPFPQSLRTRTLIFASSCQIRKCSRKHHLSSFQSKDRRRRRHRIRASDDVLAETFDEVGTIPVPQRYSVKIPVGDRHILVETGHIGRQASASVTITDGETILVETGHIGRQASASVTITDGETIVYSSVCLADTPSEPSDFFPLSVNYQERLSAAGRTSGRFFKREGRAKDHEALICRLIDRPLRPTMPKGFYHET